MAWSAVDSESHEGAEEWSMGREQNHHDQPGDDDVDIALRQNGTVEVEYREAANQQHHNTVSGP